MNNIRVEFNTLKKAKNINGLSRLVTKVKNMGGRTSGITNAIQNIINDNFTTAINEMSPSLSKKRGIEIHAEPKPQNGAYSTHFIALVKNGKNIAGMDAAIRVNMEEGKVIKWIELNSGWTLPNYSKNGPLRPTNGYGYGTILRAILVYVAKKFGCTAAIQDAAIVSKENKNKFARGNIKRPVSAWIMNKLGFNVESVNKEPGTNRIKSEHRILRLNRNTPKLNAVVRNILGT
jgi:hypothetical protein